MKFACEEKLVENLKRDREKLIKFMKYFEQQISLT